MTIRGFINPMSGAAIAWLLTTVAANGQATKIEIVPITPHELVEVVAFSPDGAYALSGGFDNAMKLWQVSSGRLIRTFQGHSNVVRSVAFSPDGKNVLSGSQDSTMKLWDVASGELLRTITGHEGTINSAAFSPDGKLIASGSRNFRGTDNTVRLWDVATGKQLRIFRGNTGEVQQVVFSPDGSKVINATGASPWIPGDRAAIRIWDSSNGQLLRTITGHSKDITSLAVSRDGTKLLSGGQDNSIKLWDFATGQLIHSIPGGNVQGGKYQSYITSVAFSPDGKLALSGGLDNSVKLWDLATDRLLRTLTGHDRDVQSVAFSPDGSRALSGSHDNTMKLWEVATGQALRTFGTRASAIKTVSISPDGRQILSGSLSEPVKLWDVLSGSLRRVFNGYDYGIDFGVFAPDGNPLLSGLVRDENSFKVFDATSGKVLRSFKAEYGEFAFTPDTAKAAAGGEGIVTLWNLAAGASARRLVHNNRTDCKNGRYCHIAIASLAFSADGSRLVSGGNDSVTKIWNAETGALVSTFPLKWGFVQSVAFSPDGQRVVTGTLDNGVRLLDAATGRLLHLMDVHKGPATSVRFSPDGSYIASGSRDSTINIWDAASGRLVRTLRGHSGNVPAVGFSPDGTRIISGGDDRTIRIWSVATGEPIATFIATVDGEWLVMTPIGFFSGSQKGAELLSVVRGLEVYSIDQLYQSLYRPDLVREQLAGDPRGLVREAAARLDLNKVLASGAAPAVRVVSPADGASSAGSQVAVEVELTERGGSVGRVEWRVNGLTVGLDSPAALQAGQQLRLTRPLSLDAGSNAIEVVAYNGANLIASAPARVTVARPAIALAPVIAPTPRLFVLAAGADNYADQRFQLAYSVLDAKAMAQAFKDTGEGLYRSVEITLLSNEEVTRSRLDAAFAELSKKIEPTDVFVLYVAGHGKTVDGRYYFAPQTFKIDGDLSNVAVNAAVMKQGIAQEQWQRWFAQVPARKSLILFDTCESGTIAKDESETRALEQEAANDRLAQATGRSIITASSGSTEAFEGYRGHGLFTYNLLDGLDRGDGDANGTIEVTELAAYVYAQVTAISEQVFKQRQEPQMKITSNYSLTRQARVLRDDGPAVVLDTKPTFQLAQTAALQIKPANGAMVVRSLSPKTAVKVLKSEGGWALVAQDGKPLGYVATRDLVPIQ